MKSLFSCSVCAMVLTASLLTVAPADGAVSLSITDNDATPTSGTVVPGGTFVFTINLTSTGEQTTGLDYLLQTLEATPGFFRIIDRRITASLYDDPLFSDLEVETEPASILDPRNDLDLGAILDNPNAPNGTGTFLVASFTLSASSSATPGTYTIQTYSNPGEGWTGIGPDFDSSPFAAHGSFSVVVVVPEVNSAGLFLVAAGGLLFASRARNFGAGFGGR